MPEQMSSLVAVRAVQNEARGMRSVEKTPPLHKTAPPSGTNRMKIDSCVSIGQFKMVAKEILMQDASHIHWLVDLARRKFSKVELGYSGLKKALDSIASYYEAGLRGPQYYQVVRRSLRRAGATTALPLSN